MIKKLAEPVLKNSLTKKVYRKTGLKKLWVEQRNTPHERNALLEQNGGVLILKNYDGPEISPKEWESLEFVTYYTDPKTFFAPIASATGKPVMEGFWKHGKADKDGIWTPNAKVAKTIKAWVESVGVRYGRIQLIRKDPNSLRETYWNLHLDDNNRLNPDEEGWVVRVWLELTDDPTSFLILRESEFDRAHELRIPLHKGSQVIVDSEYLFHSVWHNSKTTRYGVIASFESGPAFDKWVKSQLPKDVVVPHWAKTYKQKHIA